MAISFLETPLKFRAPGISVPLALGIGRLVFRALNTGELLLVVVLTVAMLTNPTSVKGPAVPGIVIALCAVLLTQVAVLRPRLDRRARQTVPTTVAPAPGLHHPGSGQGRLAGRPGDPLALALAHAHWDDTTRHRRTREHRRPGNAATSELSPSLSWAPDLRPRRRDGAGLEYLPITRASGTPCCPATTATRCRPTSTRNSDSLFTRYDFVLIKFG